MRTLIPTSYLVTSPKTTSGDDTYVLCEINASSTFAFPEHAMPTVAQAAIDRIRQRNSLWE
jgi:hypothetical protein